MWQEVNLKTHVVVDMCDYSEVKNVLEVDVENKLVKIRQLTYTEDRLVEISFPVGLKVVRRY